MSSHQLRGLPHRNPLNNSVTIASGVGAVGTSLYLRPGTPGGYFAGGIGYSSWATPFADNSNSWTGFGICAGG